VAYIDAQDAAQAVVKSLNNTESNNKIVSLIGKKFWTSQEIIELCERLSGRIAKISYIPFFAFSTLQGFFRFFESTWNIADRLQFGQIADRPELSSFPANEISWVNERLSLESYLQEYFGKIIRKLKGTNYRQVQDQRDISF